MTNTPPHRRGPAPKYGRPRTNVPDPMVTVRLPRVLVEQVRKLAVEHDRSLAGELREALRAYLRAAEED